jgi:hypothetical protein
MLNFTPWDQMLRQYVDDRGRVNYSAWQAESTQALSQWLTEVAQTPWQKDSDQNQQLACWLNLYNALVIEQILKVYPIASIRPKFLGIPNWLAFFQFFSRSIYQQHGKSYSLNDIEHGTIRPTFNDPRIHFALVCAAVGCPLLRNEAYFPERVQTQLEEEAKRFINNPAKVHYNKATQTLDCSQIFKWYRQDFLKVAPTIPTYIQTYFDPSIPLSPDTAIRYLPYDWSLNQLPEGLGNE